MAATPHARKAMPEKPSLTSPRLESGVLKGPPAVLSSSELARLTGVSTDTLRHYEREGVLGTPARSQGGYRLYPPEAVGRVRLATTTQTPPPMNPTGGRPCSLHFSLWCRESTDHRPPISRPLDQLRLLCEHGCRRGRPERVRWVDPLDPPMASRRAAHLAYTDTRRRIPS